MRLTSPAKVDQGFWWLIEISSRYSDGSSLFGVRLISADFLVKKVFCRRFQWGLNQTRLSIIQTTEVQRTLWFMEEPTRWIDGRYLFRVRWVSLVIVAGRDLSRWFNVKREKKICTQKEKKSEREKSVRGFCFWYVLLVIRVEPGT
ncbi:predicted protein [Arabidopsis lyrata subsp. lyrata]|uniref:Predicted protein n=1 Tax=Arabidopsis lyrata subsp. lyrata TaxID=81972 RepID=D7KWC7_ARALL|nr:predicted protein [Arabidopsis lyrata subsp. lyrata]